MTSSLPDFSAPPAVPPTGATTANSAGRAPDADATASNAPAGDFADLMPPDAEPAIACHDTATSMPNFTIIAPTAFTLVAAPTAKSAEAAAEASAEPLIEGAESADDTTATPATGEVSRDAMEQAASVLATVRRDNLEARGRQWSEAEEESFKAPICSQYATIASSRLWKSASISA